VETGLTLPFALPMVLGDFFRWRRSDQLPPSDPKFQSAALRSDYDSHLAGRPAAHTLDSAAQWFAQEQSRAEL
jgi:hypothetical protein